MSYDDTITALRAIVNTVNVLDDIDECIDLITDIEDTKAFFILPQIFDPRTMSIIEDLSQISSIYICSEQQLWHEQRPKVKYLTPDITTLRESLKCAAYQCDRNSISISVISTSDDESTRNLDELDSSFMYIQLLQQILSSIQFEADSVRDFTDFCREECAGNVFELRNIEKFQKEYHDQSPIWWYTSPAFLFSMLNRALRLMEVDVILHMSFFLQDLHKDITKLHIEQNRHFSSFIVYRGQGLSPSDFDRLQKSKGGLTAFNNFLSTSLDRATAFAYAESNSSNADVIGILFQMNIDSSAVSTPFANIAEISYFRAEKEVLFAMNSVFRIRNIEPTIENSQVWQVDLILTDDKDPQLCALTEHIQNELCLAEPGWHHLVDFFLEVGEFDKAEQLWTRAVKKVPADGTQLKLTHLRKGEILAEQGKYTQAIDFYQGLLEILQKHLPPEHPFTVWCFHNASKVYRQIGDFAKVLSHLEQALEIYQKLFLQMILP